MDRARVRCASCFEECSGATPPHVAIDYRETKWCVTAKAFWESVEVPSG